MHPRAPGRRPHETAMSGFPFSWRRTCRLIEKVQDSYWPLLSLLRTSAGQRNSQTTEGLWTSAHPGRHDPGGNLPASLCMSSRPASSPASPPRTLPAPDTGRNWAEVWESDSLCMNARLRNVSPHKSLPFVVPDSFRECVGFAHHLRLQGENSV